MKTLVLISVLLLAVVQAQAENRAVENRVYRGTLGGQAIVACLPSDGNAAGSYYYLQHGIDIRLQADSTPAEPGKPKVWTESAGGAPSTGTWRLTALGDNWHGSWQSPAHEHPLPLLLHAIAGACSGDDSPYRLLRAQGQLLSLGSVQSRGSFSFRELKAMQGKVRSIQITSGLPVAAMNAVNAALSRDLREQIIAALQCAGDAGSAASDYQYSATPSLISGNWISLQAHETHFCGGAYAGDASYGLTLDSHTAAPQNLATWFVKGLWQGDPILQLPPDSSLGQLLLKHMPATPAECKDVLAGNGYYNIWLTEQGMTFVPSLPQAAQTCAVAAVLSNAELQPFLQLQYKQTLGQQALGDPK